MKIMGNNTVTPLQQAKKVTNVTTSTKSEKSASFDQLSLNTNRQLEGDSLKQKEVAAKLSNEVRTHNTTGKVAQLQKEFEAGTYQVDARETASRMLLMGAVE